MSFHQQTRDNSLRMSISLTVCNKQWVSSPASLSMCRFLYSGGNFCMCQNSSCLYIFKTPSFRYGALGDLSVHLF